MIAVRGLRLMQEGFRHSTDDMIHMTYHAWQGRFDAESLRRHNPDHTNLIAITQFEDGALYIRDGFHRVVAAYFGRGFDEAQLYDGEYFIEQLTYLRMNTANFGCAYYTPFDPRTEVRVADFAAFRAKVGAMSSQEEMLEYIKAHRDAYAKPKEPHQQTVETFAEYWLWRNPKLLVHLTNIRGVPDGCVDARRTR